MPIIFGPTQTKHYLVQYNFKINLFTATIYYIDLHVKLFHSIPISFNNLPVIKKNHLLNISFLFEKKNEKKKFVHIFNPYTPPIHKSLNLSI